MIAYAFPPEGNAGAYRPLRFVRQLPGYGWNPTVVSAIPGQYERADPALLQMVPNDVEVIRVNASDGWQRFQVWRSRRVRRQSVDQQGRSSAESVQSRKQHGLWAWLREQVHVLEAMWYRPDMAMPWIAPAVRMAVERCRCRPIDVIWATAGPVSSFIVARKVSTKTGIPYVLDFRDAWTITYNEFEARRPLWLKRQVQRTMYELLKGARAVIFRYDSEAECFWRAYGGALDASRIYVIPNGYESPMEEFIAPIGDKCTIVYTGTLPDYRYDTLLAALNDLRREDPDRAEQLRFFFIGEGMDALAKDTAALSLSDIVQTEGPRSYSEIANFVRTAHALLVLGRPSTMNGYELFVGAKLFGYLKSGHPIVGILPEDETRTILHRIGVRTIADVDSVSDIIRVLRMVLDHWAMGTLASLVPDPKACQAYSSTQQTATLVRALEGVPQAEPFVPGAQAIPPSLRPVIEKTSGSLNITKSTDRRCSTSSLLWAAAFLILWGTYAVLHS